MTKEESDLLLSHQLRSISFHNDKYTMYVDNIGATERPTFTVNGASIKTLRKGFFMKMVTIE